MDFQNNCPPWYLGSLLSLEMTVCILNACSHVEIAKHVAHLRLWPTHKRWTLRWQMFLFPTSVTWALRYVIHRVPTNLQEHWVTHCCKREAIAKMGVIVHMHLLLTLKDLFKLLLPSLTLWYLSWNFTSSQVMMNLDHLHFPYRSWGMQQFYVIIETSSSIWISMS